ncbi:uncharacterized protein [Porites lutea]|uniref:uncharacterized protein n=1 Tax=Porites lutea TaxID=51062 RepID=UPI003CC53422
MTEEEALRRSQRTWYLPHHGVFHPQKQGKIRVVFDVASLHDGVSLNNQLLQGPDLTNNLLGILLRFRQYPKALVADIEGMFNQVKVPPEDSDALRLLWWEDSDLEKLSEFQMTTHSFGATDSPSCANFCLKKAAEDHKGRFSDEAVSVVENDFYIDDFVKSVGTVSEASSLADEVTCLLNEAGFRLTKSMSNSREVLSKIPDADRAKPTLDLDLENLPVERTLGVQWDVEKDAVLFKVREPHKPPTKRGILSAVSSLYDPMGFVCPVVLEAKKFLQRLWKLNLRLDDLIPEDLQSLWNEWKCKLAVLSQVQVPRCHLIDSTVVNISLHLFSDASEDGYGMCSYLRFVYACGTVRCSFLIGRSRSSPVRPISIPRLELQAVTMSVKMYRVLVDELTYKISNATFWSDSQTKLQYIKNVSKQFQTYVANCVVEIREVTSPDQWRHCPGKVNPADDASCGLKPPKRSCQHPCFPEDVKEVKPKKEVKKSSKLGNLRPVLVDGVLLVGGRLEKAVILSWDEKHPMVLPKRHHVSQLIVRHYHECAAHSGREQTLCELQRMFWIIGGRGLVKTTIRGCIRCRKMNAKPLEQFMGSLPRARLEAYHPPFTFTGVNLFGPLMVKWGRRTAKRWGCLFTCLTTRAVYLDATSSLKTDDFIIISANS